ncbi:DNA polymerase subunit beta [Candidatus Poribacteria bacterium]|nr:MAG: DNA polymerase subunit beta [Candidatus Poribacteria bacterium]
MDSPSLTHRHQEALSIAAHCAEVLQKRFGAKQVIPFGSLVGDSPWHEASDLDLAIEGLSREACWEAEAVLETLMPPWLSIHLVLLDSVPTEIRERILEGKPMDENPHAALKSRLMAEIAALEPIISGLAEALKRAGEQPDQFATRALASYVDDFYSGIERICERIAVTLDGDLPTDEQWHRTLLYQMGQLRVERPPLFSQDLLSDTDEYRRFRHRLRHIYGYELEAVRVVTLAQKTTLLFEEIRGAVLVFCDWLENSNL